MMIGWFSIVIDANVKPQDVIVRQQQRAAL